jgi:hypothetical protein
MEKGFKEISSLEDLLSLYLLTFKVFGEGSYIGEEEIIYNIK